MGDQPEHPPGVGMGVRELGAPRGYRSGWERHVPVELRTHALGGCCATKDCPRHYFPLQDLCGLATVRPSGCQVSVALTFAFPVNSASSLTQSPALAAVHHPQDLAFLGALT